MIPHILWTSTQGHIEGFGTPPFPAFLVLLRPFIGEIAQLRHYADTGVAWIATDEPPERMRLATSCHPGRERSNPARRNARPNYGGQYASIGIDRLNRVESIPLNKG